MPDEEFEEVEDSSLPSVAPDEYVPVGLGGILAATGKALAMNRGLVDQDHRDGIQFKRLMNTADFMAERVRLDAGGLLRKTLVHAARHRSLKGFMPGAFDGWAEGQLISNPLSSPLEEINPLDVHNQNRRVTLMGPGGIGSAEMVTESMRAVHPSIFGFLSVSEGPECTDGVSEVCIRRGWIPWSDVRDDDVFACWMPDGSVGWHPAERVTREHYIGDMYVFDTSLVRIKVTPNHRVVCALHQQADFRQRYARDVCTTEIFIPLARAPVAGSSSLQVYRLLGISGWKKEMVDEMVYCATVPGGRLLMRGSHTTEAYWTGNSELAGVDTRLSNGVKLGSNGRMYQRFRNPRTGDIHWLSPEDLRGKVIGLPQPPRVDSLSPAQAG